MGRLKLIEEKYIKSAQQASNSDREIMEEHVQGFLANWDSKPHGVIPYSSTVEVLAYEHGQRTAYASGVRDALRWVKEFNETNGQVPKA